MVHALQESWRVLRKKGILVDLRPLHGDMTIESLLEEESALIRCFTNDDREANDRAANAAITHLTDNNLFEFVGSAPFVYDKLYDTGQELLDYFAARNPPYVQPEDTVQQIQQADNNPELTLRLGTVMLLRTYRRLKRT